MPTNLTRRQALVLPAGIALGSLAGRSARAAEPVKIGLVAALSGQSAKSGEGITRGIAIAIDEINARGGVLGGRMLELVRRDDESNPAKGQTAARELIDKEGVVALFGGDKYYPQRRQSKLRVSSLCRRRSGGSRADQTCHDELRRKNTGADAGQ
jgi:branched-chain amino acid transport system substrate-binding protein